MENVFLASIAYVFGMSLVTFLIFGYDKWISGTGQRRIPEKRLLQFALLGGSPGALLGMSLFRHKTRKTAFQLWIGLVVLLHVAVLAAVAFFTLQ